MKFSAIYHTGYNEWARTQDLRKYALCGNSSDRSPDPRIPPLGTRMNEWMVNRLKTFQSYPHIEPLWYKSLCWNLNVGLASINYRCFDTTDQSAVVEGMTTAPFIGFLPFIVQKSIEFRSGWSFEHQKHMLAVTPDMAIVTNNFEAHKVRIFLEDILQVGQDFLSTIQAKRQIAHSKHIKLQTQ